jgi:hypothetical protein
MSKTRPKKKSRNSLSRNLHPTQPFLPPFINYYPPKVHLHALILTQQDAPSPQSVQIPRTTSTPPSPVPLSFINILCISLWYLLMALVHPAVSSSSAWKEWSVGRRCGHLCYASYLGLRMASRMDSKRSPPTPHPPNKILTHCLVINVFAVERVVGPLASPFIIVNAQVSNMKEALITEDDINLASLVIRESGGIGQTLVVIQYHTLGLICW